MTHTLYLARHGETDWNVGGRMQGRLGAPLNERGRRQSELLAARAVSLRPSLVISSPLPRALETARAVVHAAAAELRICDALMEIDFGECSGLREDEIEQRFPGLPAARSADKWRHRWPGGESYADAVARLKSAIAKGELPGPSGTLVVAHQSLNRALTHVLTGLPESDALRVAQRSDVLVRIEDGELSYASFAEGSPELSWSAGPFLAAPAKMN